MFLQAKVRQKYESQKFLSNQPVYSEASTPIPKNTSVIVRRVPTTKPIQIIETKVQPLRRPTLANTSRVRQENEPEDDKQSESTSEEENARTSPVNDRR